MKQTDALIPPELQRIAPYNSGLTLNEVREKHGMTTIAKLGSNENPLRPTGQLPVALAEISDKARNFPDPQGRALSERLAVMHGVRPEQIKRAGRVAPRFALAPGGVRRVWFPNKNRRWMLSSQCRIASLRRALAWQSKISSFTFRQRPGKAQCMAKHRMFSGGAAMESGGFA